MADDLWERIRSLEEDLLAEEESEEFEDEFEEDYDEDELRPGYNYAVDFHRAVYEDEDYGEADYAEPPKKKKGIKGLVFLAFLEILGILGIIGWWLQWLI